MDHLYRVLSWTYFAVQCSGCAPRYSFGKAVLEHIVKGRGHNWWCYTEIISHWVTTAPGCSRKLLYDLGRVSGTSSSSNKWRHFSQNRTLGGNALLCGDLEFEFQNYVWVTVPARKPSARVLAPSFVPIPMCIARENMVERPSQRLPNRNFAGITAELGMAVCSMLTLVTTLNQITQHV